MKKCMQCGAEMPGDEAFCSQCGAEFALNEVVQEPVMDSAVVIPEEVVDAAPVIEESVAVTEEEVKLEDVLDGVKEEIKPVEPIPEKPVCKKKIKWWHIAIPVIAVVAIVAALLLGPFFIYLSPKTVLAKSIGDTFQDLSARAEGTPLAVLSKAYDDTQKNSLTMNIDASQPLAGEIHFGIDIKTDNSTRQSQADIQMDLMGKEVDMNLYLDREVAAVNVDQVTGGDYYGVYYDTFGEDIRNNEFMYESLGEDNIEMYEELVDKVNQLMDLEVPTPEQQAESLGKYAEVFLDFVEEKDVQVGKAEVSLDGKTRNCKTIFFSITADEYVDLMLQLIDVAETDPMLLYYYKTNSFDVSAENWEELLDEEREILEENRDEDGTCTFTFYLHGGKVVQADMATENEEETGLLTVFFGSDASESDIVVRLEYEEDEEENAIEMTLSTQKDGDVVTETLYITEQEGDDDPFELELGYEWDRESGALNLYFQEIGEDKYELDCVLEGLENGFRFSIPAIQDLIESMGENTAGVEMSMDITMTTGAEIEVPKVKDIAKMTRTDVMNIAMKFAAIMEM